MLMTADELWERVRAFATARLADGAPVHTLVRRVPNYITSVDAEAVHRRSDEGTTNSSYVTRGTVSKVWKELHGGPYTKLLVFTRALIAAAAPDFVDVEDGILRLRNAAPARRTFILTWNPERWIWSSLDADLARMLTGERVRLRRSTGNTRKIVEGDRVYLLKQGPLPRGIMASGVVVSATEEDLHYDQARAQEGETAFYVEFELDRLVSPEAVMSVESVREGPLASVHWAMPASGIELPRDAVVALDGLWSSYVPPRSLEASPHELTPGQRHVEGAVQVVTVNRYERSPAARQACIDHWGLRCAVCTFLFEDRYGALGQGFIHVHHLDPLGDAEEEREVDPIKDLRPVCANCHAMLHRREPPVSIEELRTLLR